MWAQHLNDIMLVHNAQQLVAAKCISYLTIVSARAKQLYGPPPIFGHPFADVSPAAAAIFMPSSTRARLNGKNQRILCMTALIV